MNTHRKLIAVAIALVIAGWHAYCFVVRRDVWPFSHYEMYAGVRGTTWSALKLTGIAADSGAEIELPAEGVHPPRTIRVLTGLGRLVRMREADPTTAPLLPRALHDVVVLYNRELPAVQPDFTPLSGVRLYRLTWTRETAPDGRMTWKLMNRETLAEARVEA